LLETLGTAGNLVTAAQIASLAVEHNAILHTADADFLRVFRPAVVQPRHRRRKQQAANEVMRCLGRQALPGRETARSGAAPGSARVRLSGPP